MNKHNYVAIMAGGIGSRFWPKSRQHLPKQFLDILGTGQTLIQATYERFKRIVPEENIYIITGKNYASLVKEQLPNLKPDQIMAEPARRNTAPCVAYMAHKLAARDPYATFIVAPSDHLITETDMFIQKIKQAVKFAANNNNLVTLGIKPTRPDTGYGYIQFLPETGKDGVYRVKTFTEKPNLELAKTFLNSGDFLWNSGIFIWYGQTILQAFKQFQPDMNELFEEGAPYYNTPKEAAFVADAYAKCKSISIDYAIMEHAENVTVIPSSFGWSDLGTWTSLWENHQKDDIGNAISGENVMVYDTENCMIMVPDDKLVILQGLEGYCVIENEGILLICKKDAEQKIKAINMDVKRLKKGRFL